MQIKLHAGQKGENKRRMPVGARLGFTLVELLVVIGLLAVLVTLGFSALNRVADAGKATACLSNIRIYGGAVLTFVADNGGVLPDRSIAVPPPLRYGQWVQNYLGKPLKEFRCPLANREERKLSTGFTYNGNSALTIYYHTLRGIPVPTSRVVLAAEMYDWVAGFEVPGHFNRTIWGNGNGGVVPADEGTVRRPQYHGSADKRGLHMFFLDGHAELVGAVNNDWGKSPTLGDSKNGGYFYTTSQFSSMTRGMLSVQ